jgi:hypothetical protein
MIVQTVTHGIFQSDIVIRSAIVQGLAYLRESPWLLDYVFAYLPHDDLTSNSWGLEELNKAKEWFLRTQIQVRLGFDSAEPPRTPTVVIVLDDSSEAATTLGDVSAQGVEETTDFYDYVIKPNIILGPFTPKSFDSTTGLVVLPDDLDTTNIHESMYLMDNVNKVAYSINTVDIGQEFYIDEDVRANFTNATIISQNSLHKVQLESLVEREVYRLELFCSSSTTNLIYLHSIIKFILLRYRQSLLEKRGFERSNFYSTGLRLFRDDLPEIIYTRSIVLAGYVVQYWPKEVTGMIDGLHIGTFKIKDGPASPDALETQIVDQGWEMENDSW